MKRWLFGIGLLASVAGAADLDPSTYASLKASATGSTFVVHAAEPATAQAALIMVGRLQAEICGLLATSAPPSARVIWFTDRADWTNCLRSAGLSGNERSLAGGDFIAICASSNDANEPLAHELVHAALKQTAYYPLPLWLEEGFALYAGWRVASAIARQDGQDLRRRLPPLQERDLLSFDRLLSLRDYPEDAAENVVFYRQCEELVRLLIEKHGEEKFFKLALYISRGDTLRHCLERRFNYGEKQFEQLEDYVRVRATSKQSW